ncbi:MAG TPA: rod shape-determining protein MreC [Candidatus Saccharimonadales bacterium]|nr:rod shape-determining protein MreC [Candidatus Saccharimonadales bacterium]
MKKLFVAFVILALGFLGVFNPFRTVVQYIFTPVEFGLKNTASSIKDTGNFFIALKGLRDQNISLIKENQNLKSIILSLKQADDENKILRTQLNLKNRNTFDKKLLLANVMGNAKDLTGGSVIIDKGTRQGVKAGSNVILANYLVGIVKDTQSERSLVSLITSPDISATVRDIDVAQHTEGLAVGQYGTSIQMTRILPNEVINVGDTIVTSGKDGIFDANLLLGKVVKVVSVPAEPLKSAYIETQIDLANLDKVFVIIE